MPLSDYLYDYPLLVRYVSLKELEGDLLYEQNNPAAIKLDDRSLVPWQWPKSEVDITLAPRVPRNSASRRVEAGTSD